MAGQERATHTAAECSVGEDTHVQIMHRLCPHCREGQKCTQCTKKGQRRTNELCTGNTGSIKSSTRLTDVCKPKRKGETDVATLMDASMGVPNGCDKSNK